MRTVLKGGAFQIYNYAYSQQPLSTSEAFRCLGAGIIVPAHGLDQGGIFHRMVHEPLQVSMLAPLVTTESPNWEPGSF